MRPQVERKNHKIRRQEIRTNERRTKMGGGGQLGLMAGNWARGADQNLIVWVRGGSNGLKDLHRIRVMLGS